MDFTLTPELKQLQSRVRALVDDVLQPLELEAEQSHGRLSAEAHGRVKQAVLDAGLNAANIPTVQEFLAVGDFPAGRAWLEAHPDALGNGYNFAKQAIIVWTMMQGVELGPRGIRINCIGPTVTDTPFLADTIKTYGEGFIDAFPKPLGRVSRPDEQARALVFLNSDAASYITGTILWTDGGYMGGAATGLIKTG